MEAQVVPAVEARDRFCLHRLRDGTFCYEPTTHVLFRPSDGFASPVCDLHVATAQLAFDGRFEVVPLPMWIADHWGDHTG